MNLVGILEDTGEEVERYDNFTFQLSDQEVVQGIFFFLYFNWQIDNH